MIRTLLTVAGLELGAVLSLALMFAVSFVVAVTWQRLHARREPPIPRARCHKRR